MENYDKVVFELLCNIMHSDYNIYPALSRGRPTQVLYSCRTMYLNFGIISDIHSIYFIWFFATMRCFNQFNHCKNIYIIYLLISSTLNAD